MDCTEFSSHEMAEVGCVNRGAAKEDEEVEAAVEGRPHSCRSASSWSLSIRTEVSLEALASREDETVATEAE